jgi:hypothetical protein
MITGGTNSTRKRAATHGEECVRSNVRTASAMAAAYVPMAEMVAASQ